MFFHSQRSLSQCARPSAGKALSVWSLCLSVATVLGTTAVAAPPVAHSTSARLQALPFALPPIHILASSVPASKGRLPRLLFAFQKPAPASLSQGHSPSSAPSASPSSFLNTPQEALSWVARTDLRVRLEPGSGTARVETADGLLYAFAPDGQGHYLAPAGSTALLTRLPDRFVLRTETGVRYDFGRWAEQWLPVRLSEASGQEVRFTREPGGQLVRLESAFKENGSGEAVSFCYNGAHELVYALDAQGRRWTLNRRGQWTASVSSSPVSTPSVSSPGSSGD